MSFREKDASWIFTSAPAAGGDESDPRRTDGVRRGPRPSAGGYASTILAAGAFFFTDATPARAAFFVS